MTEIYSTALRARRRSRNESPSSPLLIVIRRRCFWYGPPLCLFVLIKCHFLGECEVSLVTTLLGRSFFFFLALHTCFVSSSPHLFGLFLALHNCFVSGSPHLFGLVLALQTCLVCFLLSTLVWFLALTPVWFLAFHIWLVSGSSHLFGFWLSTPGWFLALHTCLVSVCPHLVGFWLSTPLWFLAFNTCLVSNSPHLFDLMPFLHVSIPLLFEPRHDKTRKMTGALSEDSVQSGHAMRSVLRDGEPINSKRTINMKV